MTRTAVLVADDYSLGLADRQLEAWVADHRGGPVKFDVFEARAQGRARALARARVPALPRVTDLAIGTPAGTLAMRLYEPEGAGGQLVVYLHGGMWMLGDLETHDRARADCWAMRPACASSPSISAAPPSTTGRRRSRMGWRPWRGRTRRSRRGPPCWPATARAGTSRCSSRSACARRPVPAAACCSPVQTLTCG